MTTPNREDDARRPQNDTDDGTEEWTGGQREQSAPPQDADVEDLPELSEEEDSPVRPENS